MASINNILLNGVIHDLIGELSLGINPIDDLLYIYIDGVPVGDGVDIGGGSMGTRYSIAWDLKNCSASPQIASILENKKLLTTITPNQGYTIADVAVSMGNSDITSSAYSNGVITINSVTGNVEISVTAKDYISGRLLVWEDDFDGTELDLTKWRYRLHGAESWSRLSDKGISVSDSILDINVRYDSENDSWINTIINTNALEEIKYGRLEAKMKCDEGVDQAFWTCGQTFTQYNGSNQGRIWPYCGEVDIMEILHTTKSSSTLHWKNSVSGQDSLPVGSTSGIDVKDWHVYAMEWTPTSMSFYCDDVLVGTADISDIEYSDGFKPFNEPHYMILDATNAGSDTTKEYHTYVDWVRVYAPVGVNQKADITALALSENTTNLNKNKTKYLELSITPANPTDSTLIWESSNNAVATFTGGNTIDTKANGTATLTVRSKNGVSASTTLTVSDSVVNLVQNISISFVATDKYVVGESLQLTANVSPAWATNASITWSSSNTGVATVSNSGLVEFISAGNVVITASASDGSGVTATQAFTVSRAYEDLIDTTGCVSKMTRNGMRNGAWTNDIANAGDATSTSTLTYTNGKGMQARYANMHAQTVADLVDIDGPFTMVSRHLYPSNMEHNATVEMRLGVVDSQNGMIEVRNSDVYVRNSTGGAIGPNWGQYVPRINNNAEDFIRTVVITKASDKTMKIYVNGMLMSTSTAFVDIADMDITDIVFNCNSQPTNTYAQALLLYNRELNATEVSTLQSALDTMWPS